MPRGTRSARCLSLSLSLSTVVLLIHSDIVSITAIGSIRVRATIILCVLGSIISSISWTVHTSRRWTVRSTTCVSSITTISAVRAAVGTMGTAMRTTVGMVTVAATVVPIASITVTTVAITAAIARWATLEFLVLLLDVGDQILTKLLCLLNHVGVRSSDVKKHVLITLMVGSRLQVARSPALDLHTAASLLLDVLHISTTMPDDLSAQVETVYRL